jgi:hypothetical protein
MARKKKEEVVEEAPKAKGKGKAKKETPVATKKTRGKKAAVVEEEVVEVEEVVEEKAPVVEKKTKGKKGKKEVPVKRGRGRIAGVRNELTKKDQALIQDQFSMLEAQFDELVENVSIFIEKANKASVGKARKNIQEFARMGKVFRKTLQDAKGNMKQVPIS